MLKKTLVAVAAVTTALLLAEGASRLFFTDDWFPEPLTARGVNPDNFSILSALTHHTEPDPAEFRIVITGGSAAYGWGASSPDKRFSSLLEKNLEGHFSGRRLRVINAGVPDFEAVDELALYLHHVRRLKPDMVIMFTGFNDLWESVRGQLVSGHSARLQKAFEHRVVGPRESGELLLAFVRSVFANAGSFMERNSRLYRWLKYKREMMGYLPIKNLADFDEERGRESLRTLLDAVGAFEHAASVNKTRFVLVVQPVRALTNLKQSKFPISRYEAVMGKLYREFLRPGLAALSKRQGFPFYDLNNTLSGDLAVAGDFLDFCHLNDRGNEKIAKELATIVRKESKR